jgi:hypothetical protein
MIYDEVITALLAKLLFCFKQLKSITVDNESGTPYETKNHSEVKLFNNPFMIPFFMSSSDRTFLR